MALKHSYLAHFLKPYVGSIESHYTWNSKADRAAEVLGGGLEGATPFAQTLDLKRKMHLAILQTHDATQKLKLAKFIVQEWGGMIAIKDETLEEMVFTLDPLFGEPHPRGFCFPIANISSASMWLSVLCPDWAAIYDTRVAWALNAISAITHAGAKVFPIPPGRNGTLALLDASTLALAARMRQLAVEARLTELANIHEQHYVPRLRSYVEYLDVLQHAHWELWPERTPIAYTEMLLFGLADTTIFRDLVKSI